jgi:hypothetical protein
MEGSATEHTQGFGLQRRTRPFFFRLHASLAPGLTCTSLILESFTDISCRSSSPREASALSFRVSTVMDLLSLSLSLIFTYAMPPPPIVDAPVQQKDDRVGFCWWNSSACLWEGG